MGKARIGKILQMLESISDVVSSLEDSQQVCDLLVGLVTDTLGVSKCSIMLLEPGNDILKIKAAAGLSEEVIRSAETRVGEGIAGWVVERGKPLLIRDVDSDPRFGGARKTNPDKYANSSLLSVPLIMRNRAVGVLNVNNKKDGSSFDPSDEAVLRVVARFVTISLEKSHMQEIVAQKEQLDAEIQTARRIQEMILPRKFPRRAGLDIAAENLPASMVAGDFYDVLLANDGKIWVVIGDVCGKGLPASLYMARVVGYFRAVCNYHNSPAEMMSAINGHLARDSEEGSTFVTASALSMDPGSGSVTICAAGHFPPILCGHNERAVRLESGGGLPLGIDRDAEFDDSEHPFLPGQALLFYTDGVTEASDPGGEYFGNDRLLDTVSLLDGGSRKIIDGVLKSVYAFSGTRVLDDDLTLVAVRRRNVK